MKICQKHFETIKNEIENQGMSHLVADSSEEVAQRFKHSKPEPLMHVLQAICGKAFSVGGPKVIGSCPVCFAMEHAEKEGITQEEMEENWTIDPVKACVQAYTERGWL